MAFSLACDDGASPTVLRIEGADTGITWNDIWEFGAGSGNGVVTGDANGDAAVSDFMTEHIADALYTILLDVEFGDDTNVLEFESLNEMVYFVTNYKFEVMDNSKLELGEKQGDYGRKGSAWSICPSATNAYLIGDGSTGAIFNLYASRLELRVDKQYILGEGTYEFNKSIISGTGLSCQLYFKAGTGVFKDLYIDNIGRILLYDAALTIDGFHIHSSYWGLRSYKDNTVTGLLMTDTYGTGLEVKDMLGDTFRIVNPEFHLALVSNDHADSVVKEQYTCDILVVDEDGSAVGGPEILCRRTALVSYDSKAYKAKRETVNNLPDESPDDWEDVSSIYTHGDITAWDDTLTYVFEEEMFDEQQSGRIEIDCDDHAAIEGIYVEQRGVLSNSLPTYKLDGQSWYIWKDTTWWRISSAVGTTAGSYAGSSSSPLDNYEAPDGYDDVAAPTSLSPTQIDTQYLDRITWETAYELERQWVYEFIITHYLYPDLTLARQLVTEPIDWRIDMGLSLADLNDTVQAVVVANKLDHLVAVAESSDVVNSSIIAKLCSSAATPAFSSFDNTTDSLQSIRDGVNVAEVGGDDIQQSDGYLKVVDADGYDIATGGMQDVLDVLLRTILDSTIMTVTTVASLASQISFTLSAGSVDDDAYNDCMIILKSVLVPASKAIGLISDYTGSSKTVTLIADPGVFTLAVGDEVFVMAVPTKKMDDIKKLIRADKVIDAGETPWVVDYKKEGTETVLMSKTMKNTDGNDITTKNNVLGKLEQE